MVISKSNKTITENNIQNILMAMNEGSCKAIATVEVRGTETHLLEISNHTCTPLSSEEASKHAIISWYKENTGDQYGNRFYARRALRYRSLHEAEEALACQADYGRERMILDAKHCNKHQVYDQILSYILI